MALAGGASVRHPQEQGYLYEEGGIASPDGHCRAFDAEAQGIVGANGAAVVLLKPLRAALEDRDRIRAVILGSAVNNDGAGRVSFTAPSVEGQAAVIADALRMADVPAASISYVEAHGTGTALGDVVEVAGLTTAFRASTDAKQYCALGSLKTNIGHLDTAAGVAGLIKVVLALEHRELPPTVHFRSPNPQIDFASSPFVVHGHLRPWSSDGPRRAGVSSFGIGGTNAHVVIEEAPLAAPSPPPRAQNLLVLSAKTAPALAAARTKIAEYLAEHLDSNASDVAWTLQAGRRELEHRCAVVYGDLSEAVEALRGRPAEVMTATRGQEPCPIAFLFPGQGAQRVGMARQLYGCESIFRRELDRCNEYLQPLIGVNLLDVLHPRAAQENGGDALLKQTFLAQPALFSIEYALARLWMSWGLTPTALLGHSIGEYVAACLAGVFSVETALKVVAVRGRLMQELPKGAMLSVALSEAAVFSELKRDVWLAAVNGPDLCTVAGSEAAVRSFEKALTDRGVACRILETSHAFHSEMMDPMLEPFAREVERASPQPPSIPFLSNVSGRWITEREATDAGYWARHARETVRFSACLRTLAAQSRWLAIEVGPGRGLTTLTRAHSELTNRIVGIPCLEPSSDPDDVQMLRALGRVWLEGARVRWSGLHAGAKRHRLSLPTYPFERQRFWVEPPDGGIRTSGEAAIDSSRVQLFVPAWKQADRSVRGAAWTRRPRGSPSFPRSSRKRCERQ